MDLFGVTSTDLVSTMPALFPPLFIAPSLLNTCFSYLDPLDADSDDESVENEVEIEDGIEAEPVPYIFKVSVSLKDIISGGYRLVYAHPEAFLEAAQGKCLIRTPAFRKRVACVAIDEAHMVAQW